MDDEVKEESQEILDAASAVILNLLPVKSRKLYDAAYNRFRTWCSEKKAQTYTENVMLAYFNEVSKKYKASTVWAQYSMIRSCVLVHDNIDISKYPKLLAFLKRNAQGYQGKKSKVLSRNQIETFLSAADDNEYLMIKVAVVFGIAGALRSDELANVAVDDIEDVKSSLIVKVPNTKTKIPRTFVITSGNVNFIEIYRKYAKLRPSNVNHRCFFIFYKGGKCTSQPVGKNTFGKIPSVVATYLGLPEPLMYTGHSLRRSSATLLADSGADITTIKRHGGWKSTAVAEGYIQDSVQNKTNIAKQVLQGVSSSMCVNQNTVNLTSNEKVLSDFPSNINFSNCATVSFTVNVNK